MGLKDKEHNSIVKELSTIVKLKNTEFESRLTVTNGHITQMNLNDLNLKVIPKEIEKIPTITNLELDNNSLSSFSVNLPQLKILSISGNSIESIDVSKFENLQDLNISRNKFLSLDSLNLKNLKYIDASGNEITKLFDLNLPNHEYLDLNSNKISTLKAETLNFPKLKYLDLSKNNLSEIPDLSNVPELLGLHLSNNKI